MCTMVNFMSCLRPLVFLKWVIVGYKDFKKNHTVLEIGHSCVFGGIPVNLEPKRLEGKEWVEELD